MESARILLSKPIFWESITLAGALVMGTHYMVSRHSLWLGVGKQEQKIIGRYITGVFSIGIPLSFLCWEFTLWSAMGLFWACAVVAGASTMLFYRIDAGLDDAKERRAQYKDATTKAAMDAGDGQ